MGSVTATATPDRPIDIYARVSRLGDDRQLPTDSQVTECRARLQDEGLPAGLVHVDDGKSAWNPRVKRKHWNDLMARLESGVAGGVIVFDLARFSRRPIEGERLIAAAERGLLVLDSESAYDLTTASGKKAFRDQLAGAAYESDRQSTRVARGKRQRARGGGRAKDGTVLPPAPNGGHRPFGFEPDLVTVREDEAAVLREIAARFLAGESQDKLIADLNARGIKTSFDGRWARPGLRAVLARQRNAGRITYRGEITGHLPGEPILEPEDLDRIVATFAARRPGRPPSPDYLCSGVAVCGRCGTRLSGRPRANMRPYPDGEVRRQYWCAYTHGGCGKLNIDQRALDEAARALAVAILSDPRHAAAVEAAAARTAAEAADLDGQITAAEELAGQLAGRLGRGEITLARYDAATGPLDARLAKLRAARAELAAPAPVPPALAEAAWAGRWDEADGGEKRRLLRMALRGRLLRIAPAVPGRTAVTERVDLVSPGR
jgi:hypothetical protein